ncbi:metal ABC transporter permease [uncultured Methylobacterium sp.]|uniref:metal ABC transporter permease n=1 Tax=uncultured Methylobacterium sp. TaxID=157278 RepID=UPI002621CBD8|nr:metal ABC transporter permease [uncultured Methylobacterium sp.]
MTKLTSIAFLGLLALAGPALAAPQVERLRGTIEKTESGTVTIRTDDGAARTVALADDTRISSLVPASLDGVRDGSYIGTATKDGDPPVALEVLIFPEALRGAGEGHRPWDALPDTTAGGAPVESRMTNGTVRPPEVQTRMTNGTVGTRKAGDGTTLLTVGYGGGKALTVAVPPGTPVVTLEPGSRALLVAGAKVFVIASRDGDRLEGRSISVGKDGLRPPM